LVPFKAITDEESSEVDMVFRKNRVAERKDWLSSYTPGVSVDYGWH
jgi:DNA topoisomerase 2